MAYAPGFGDIVTGLDLVRKIYLYGFKASATEQYNQFRTGIENFEKSVKALNDAVRNAQANHQAGGTNSGSSLNENDPILGDFLVTLQDCNVFLEKNQKLRARSNLIQNLQWYLSQQDQRVNELYERLRFHSEKFRLVTDCVALDIASDTLANTEDILFRLDSGVIVRDPLHSEDEHTASNDLGQRFQQRLDADARWDPQTGISLQEGFDALVLLWEKCSGVLGPSAESYILFLKARWFLKYLKSTKGYKSATPGQCYKLAINRIDKEILLKIREGWQLNPCDEDRLLQLPDSHFRILPPLAEHNGRENKLLPGAGEELIACVKLASPTPNPQEYVSVFKDSRKVLRILTFTRDTSNGSDPDPGEQLRVYPWEDLLVPRYANPGVSDTLWEMCILARGGENVYTFQGWEDLRIFQAALIGYEAPHGQFGIHCQFSRSLEHLDCDGYLQLWQDPIPPLQTAGDTSTIEEVLRTGQLPVSQGDNNPHTPSSSSSRSSVADTATGRIKTRTIKLPAIVIFTTLENMKPNRRAIIFVRLDSHIDVDPGACGCSRSYGDCLHIVLKGEKGQDICFRILYSGADSANGVTAHSFNLFPFRLPLGEQFKKLGKHKTRELMLSFAELEDKERFHKQLHFRLVLRKCQEEEQAEQARRRQESHRRQTNGYRGSPRNDSPSVTLPTELNPSTPAPASLPPQIETPDTGPPFMSLFRDTRNSITTPPQARRDSRLSRLRTNSSLSVTSLLSLRSRRREDVTRDG